MRKIYKKLACAAICAATAATLAFAPACSGYYNKINLDGNTDGDVVSNGGFVVQKGGYVYFVNGIADYTDDNTYGDVVKGAIMRISTADLEAGNYADAETVVPQIYYSGSYDTGIYIYGDKIYYSTPSTEVNSDGEIQNSYLEFKSANLDGSQAMKGYYYQASSNSIEYRYVEMKDENGEDTVYLLYVASESYYETDDSCTNLHSVNTKTGEDTLLAYDISSYTFDEGDSESGVVYYTMAVTDGLGGDNEISMTYNQLWRVEANATSADNVAADYDFSYIEWDDDEDEYPVYTNCGELVLDGIGRINGKYYSTQYNEYGAVSAEYDKINHPDYTYELSSFNNGTLYYTITATATMLYTLDDSTVMESGDALTRNDTASLYLIDGDNADNYTFIDVNGTTMALYTENYRLMLGTVEGGEVVNGYCITPYSSDTPELIFADDTYLYYAMSGNNDTAIYRVNYTGSSEKYNTLSSSTKDDADYEEQYEYTSVKILDIEYTASWFIPEIIDNHLFFASATDEMASYDYIMCCDLTSEETGDIMTNYEINEYNEQYNGLLDALDEIDEDEYANLTNALYYLFYTGDEDYLDDLIQAYVNIEGQDEEYLYSKESAQIYHDFAKAQDGDMSWASYGEKTKTINGNPVNSNMRDYYYSVIGEMTEDDYDDYIDALKAAYFEDYPEDTSTWWDNLNLAAKICFIVGMCVAGLIVIGGVTILVIGLVKHFRKKNADDEPDDRLDVDITDDKSIDVYEDGESDEDDEDDGDESEE